MITKLTKEQEALLPTYAEKWLKIGLCTDRVDPATATWISNYYYTNLLYKKQVPIIIKESPLSALREVRNQVGNQVRNQVGNQVRGQVRNQVRDMAIHRWPLLKRPLFFL